MSKSNSNSKNNLKKTLTAKEVSMIAISGSMGTGIFLAMGDTIKQGGVGNAALGFIIMAIVVYFICSSLGEMSTYSPDSGSLGSYGSRFVDPAFGFALSWDYWFNKTVVIAAEIVAGTIIIKYWFPHLSTVLASAIFLAFVVVLNFLSAKIYGKIEYWLTAIKVVTVIIFIIVGILMIVGIIGDRALLFKNYFANGGPFIGGIKNLPSILMIAGMSFIGTELVGVAAGECKDPEKEVPKAINMTVKRISMLYVCTILIVGAIIPPDQAGINTSVFTLAFAKVGIPGAATIMNLVILSSVLSAASSDMYAASRLVYSMSLNGHAPKIFNKVTKHGLPVYGLIFSIAIASMCLLTGVYAQNTVYMWLITLASVSGFIGWFGISVSHYRFRKAFVVQFGSTDKLPYRAKPFPFGVILSLVAIIIVTFGLGISDLAQDNIAGAIVSYAGVILFIAIWLFYKIKNKSTLIELKDIELKIPED